MTKDRIAKLPVTAHLIAAVMPLPFGTEILDATFDHDCVILTVRHHDLPEVDTSQPLPTVNCIIKTVAAHFEPIK